MATNNTLQHPRHEENPLVLRNFRNDSIAHICDLCFRKISADGYTCQGDLKSYYYHRGCAEAPPRIDHHPLHPDHPLILLHLPPPFRRHACNFCFRFSGSLFRCDECDFNLDIRCALCTLSDQGDALGGTTPEQIDLPLHPHRLTSFSTRHDFVGDGVCLICKASVQGDGYMCLQGLCKFIIHKGCIHDLNYADGTKAPRIYHGHPLNIFLGEDTGTSRCAKCKSDEPGEFIGCAGCEVFIHRNCIQLPEIIQYPHHPEHTLVLFINFPDKDKPRCDSCSVSLEGELCYGCPSCEFFAHVGCALQVLAHCEEGMRAEIDLSWHEHPLLLCNRTKSDSDYCSRCEDESDGPMYSCKVNGCEILLHERCIEIESTIIHPHHPDHPLTLRNGADWRDCKACCEPIFLLSFSCELCAFYIHAKCAAHFPTRKHCLHEHELLHLDVARSCECNRCRTSTYASLFRCVLCNFNLHEECMELPQIVKSEIHWHSLTLQETFVEDDSGKYYCEHCEKTRDIRLGVYVCGKCKISLPRIYHIECVLPELRKVYEKKGGQTSVIKILNERIARKDKEVCVTEVKLEEMKRELEEMKKVRDELISREDED